MSDDLGKSVRDRLLHTSGVTAIVGSQVYPDVLDQNAKPPAIAVWVDSGQPELDLNTDNALGGQQVVVLAWGETRAQSTLLAKAIRTALPPSLRGSVEGMDWQECTLIAGPAELVDAPIDGSGAWRRAIRQIFTIWATPT